MRLPNPSIPTKGPSHDHCFTGVKARLAPSCELEISTDSQWPRLSIFISRWACSRLHRNLPKLVSLPPRPSVLHRLPGFLSSPRTCPNAPLRNRGYVLSSSNSLESNFDRCPFRAGQFSTISIRAHHGHVRSSAEWHSTSTLSTSSNFQGPSVDTRNISCLCFRIAFSTLSLVHHA
jgi:hypothetical protein